MTKRHILDRAGGRTTAQFKGKVSQRLVVPVWMLGIILAGVLPAIGEGHIVHLVRLQKDLFEVPCRLFGAQAVRAGAVHRAPPGKQGSEGETQVALQQWKVAPRIVR